MTNIIPHSIAGVACCDPWMWPLTYLKSEEKSEPTAADEANSKTPYLVMHAEYFQWPANLDSERSLVRAVQSVLHVRIRDAGHNNFSDTGFLSPVIMGMVMSPKKVGMQDPVQLQELINDMLVTFFADCHTSPSPPAPDAPTTIAAVDIHNWKPTALNKSLSLAQKANSFEVLEARW